MGEIQAVLISPDLKVVKPSDTRWLAQERCVRAVRQILPALVQTFEHIYTESGDAEAYGLSKLLCTDKFVASLYMLCDVLQTIAKLQGCLQSKDLDLSVVPAMVQSTVDALKELKDNPTHSTWFKDHSTVFSDPNKLGHLDIAISESTKESFMRNIYKPYIQSVVDHISAKMKSSDVLSAFSLFNPCHLPEKEDDLSEYGSEKLSTLRSFYGTPQIVTFESKTGHSVPNVRTEQIDVEWKIFRRLMFAKFKTAIFTIHQKKALKTYRVPTTKTRTRKRHTHTLTGFIMELQKWLSINQKDLILPHQRKIAKKVK